MLAQIEMLRDHGAQAAEWAAAALDGGIDPAQASQTRAIRANAMLTAGQGRAALACSPISLRIPSTWRCDVTPSSQSGASSGPCSGAS